MALSSSPESPLPLRTVARAVGDWVGRLGRVWVEGQLAELRVRPGTATVFATLRDPHAELSMQLSCGREVVEAVHPPLAGGARVVAWVQPEVWLARGSLSLRAHDIRPVGVGALLARLEQLRRLLAAEGLFAAARKRPLPFVPGVVGVVTGRGSAAERDVVDNARRRWPGVRFRVVNVAVQGPTAGAEMIAALRRLDADPDVDVIVLARGGGSLEDLLPFSDEALCRAVAACRTPVVSAVGHESDTPLVDFVADRRASTPTDAGKLVVPDVAAEQAALVQLRARARRCVAARLAEESRTLQALRSRPALARPHGEVRRRVEELAELRRRARRCATARLDGGAAELGQLRARVLALSPAATLTRGYAVLQQADGTVVRDPGQVRDGEVLAGRVAGGRMPLTVTPGAA